MTGLVPELQGTGDRVEALLQRFTGPLAPLDAHAAAEELVRLLTELYGAGIARVLDIVFDAAGERAEAVFHSLAADKLVASLLILHGLHPDTLEERVQAALDKTRPYLNSHEGDVAISHIENGVVHLRLSGSCHGCPSSLETVKLTLEAAIFEAAPEITEVRAHGSSADAPAQRHDSDWLALDDYPALGSDGVTTLEVAGSPVLLAMAENVVRAYRNQCPRCLHGLAGARMYWPWLACRHCEQRFDLAQGGRADDGAALALETFAVTYDVRDARRLRLAIPVTA